MSDTPRIGEAQREISAIAVQRNWRGYSARTRFTKWRRAAVMIQAVFKGFKVRQDCIFKKEMMMLEKQMADENRRHEIAVRALKEHTEYINALGTAEFALKEDKKRDDSARMIQNWWRGCVMHGKRFNVQEMMLDRAVRILQQRFRSRRRTEKKVYSTVVENGVYKWPPMFSIPKMPTANKDAIATIHSQLSADSSLSLTSMSDDNSMTPEQLDSQLTAIRNQEYSRWRSLNAAKNSKYNMRVQTRHTFHMLQNPHRLSADDGDDSLFLLHYPYPDSERVQWARDMHRMMMEQARMPWYELLDHDGVNYDIEGFVKFAKHTQSDTSMKLDDHMKYTYNAKRRLLMTMIQSKVPNGNTRPPTRA